MNSLRSSLWILNAASKVWVLEQIQFTVLSCVTHMTILTAVFRVVNVRHQACQSFVTSLCPFCDWSSKFVTDHTISSLPIRARYKHSKTFVSNIRDVSNWFQFLLLELMIQARTGNFVKLLSFLVCQFAVSCFVSVASSRKYVTRTF